MKLDIDEEVWVKGRVHCVNNIDNVAIVEITDFRKNGSKFENFTAVFPYDCLKKMTDDEH